MLLTNPVAILLLSALSSGPTATLKGRVTLPNGKPAVEAVVSFKGDAPARPIQGAVMDQKGKRFIPHVLVVPVGTVVTFPNHDDVFHNVFAHFHAKRFDLGMYPQGAVKKQLFDKAGLIALFCNVHSEMSAFIMVVDTPFYAVTDSQGRFSIPNVPEGTYMVQGWHESGSKLTQKLQFGGGSEIDLKLERK